MECTVIIPTLELALSVTDLLIEEISCKSKTIKKIIIINNRKTPTLSGRYAHLPNIVFLDDLPNMVVNPAWNYGMTLVETKYYLLLNDDLMVRGSLIDEIVNLLDSESSLNLTTVATHRIFGVNHKNVSQMHHDYSNNKLVTPLRYKKFIYPDGRQGWFMLGRRDSWVPIKLGECGNLFHGDDWIYQRNIESYKFSPMIDNNFLWHFESTSSRHSDKNFIENISKVWDPNHKIFMDM